MNQIEKVLDEWYAKKPRNEVGVKEFILDDLIELSFILNKVTISKDVLREKIKELIYKGYGEDGCLDSLENDLLNKGDGG